ncbi:hypothetical protein KBI52_08165 [Microvirga sp. HBU67558]|uniref:hypothetical protein n=1 Tax=Microvirga TaxID=186650 RepID=UPI001B389216|nr:MULTISPECIES: hypothetical protein [unclassified Microvirga]MBQ0820184.1 hypothetical protein [Microvirga sp. HBU67558]
MKLKNRDLSECERRLGTADAPFVQQEDRTVRTVLLALVIVAVVVLAWVAVYLLDLKWMPQGINKRPLELHSSRFWRDNSSTPK